MTNKYLTLALFLFLPLSAMADNGEHPLELRTHCDKISGKLASIKYKECLSLGFEVTEGKSVNQHPILIKRFNMDSTNQDAQRVLLIGGIHGNEYSSISVTFKWIALLEKYYTGPHQWQVAPLLNPDGLLQRRSKKVNANGIDLNRNFPSENDHSLATEYWQNETNWDPDYFPGKQALSEPEARWLNDEIINYKPTAIIVIHAPHISQTYSQGHQSDNEKPIFGAQYQESISAPPGSFNHYVGTMLDTPILTVELPYADVMPTADEINDMWKNIIKWLNENTH